MSLSFFRAINPYSKNSGIQYSLAGNTPCQGTEMIDSTFFERLCEVYAMDLDYWQAMEASFELIVGTHYDLPLKGRMDSHGGAKGALDFLYFPLVARKLIADSFLPERRKSGYLNTFALMIAAPLEAMRFSCALVITILLAPIIALVTFCKKCLSSNEEENTETKHLKTP